MRKVDSATDATKEPNGFLFKQQPKEFVSIKNLNCCFIRRLMVPFQHPVATSFIRYVFIFIVICMFCNKIDCVVGVVLQL